MSTFPGGSPTVTARHLTVIGHPTLGGTGVTSDGSDAGFTASLDVRDSVFSGLTLDLERVAVRRLGNLGVRLIAVAPDSTGSPRSNSRRGKLLAPPPKLRR